MAERLSYSSLFQRLFSTCRCQPARSQWLPQSYRRGSHTIAAPGRQLLVTRGCELRGSVKNPGPPRGSQAPRAAVHNNSRTMIEELQHGVEWKLRNDVVPRGRQQELSNYPMTTAEDMRKKRKRPKRSKMLMRDFIDDSLYNPSYGYFSNQAVIFNAGEPFDFNAMKDEAEFNAMLGQRYTDFEDSLDRDEQNDSRQLWHTPTELFRPHYAEAIARYMVSNYKMTNYPYHDLIIYEMGAGNGTFMLNVLDYIRLSDPQVYARTKYKIIEISANLAGLQKTALMASAAAHDHADKVEVINQSIFTWDTYVASPCFFLALEVIDNFAHDVIRYNPRTEAPLQGTVLIDTNGEFYEFFTPDLDPVASRFLRIRAAACESEVPFTHPLRWSRWRRAMRAYLPFAPNMSEPEWIPTRCMQFFDVLQKYFPGHRLLLSDFKSLPNAVAGLNAPVVQTRHMRRTIPVTTPLVHQGYFDILFPTDFAVMEGMYKAITGRFTHVLSHEEFLERWAFIEATECLNGENPLLSWYRNASFMATI